MISRHSTKEMGPKHSPKGTFFISRHLIKEMASHWPCLKENMSHGRVEKGNNI
jgi:hypothetical protein